MFIRSENEIISLMPTARWSRPDQIYGYVEEEERVALEPLLGTTLYQHLCNEYERLRKEYGDITSTTIKPTGKAKKDEFYTQAISVFEELDDYSDSADYLREAKYLYCKENGNCTDSLTYEYMKELKKAGYKPRHRLTAAVSGGRRQRR